MTKIVSLSILVDDELDISSFSLEHFFDVIQNWRANGQLIDAKHSSELVIHELDDSLNNETYLK